MRIARGEGGDQNRVGLSSKPAGVNADIVCGFAKISEHACVYAGAVVVFLGLLLTFIYKGQ